MKLGIAGMKGKVQSGIDGFIEGKFFLNKKFRGEKLNKKEFTNLTTLVINLYEERVLR